MLTNGHSPTSNAAHPHSPRQLVGIDPIYNYMPVNHKLTNVSHYRMHTKPGANLYGTSLVVRASLARGKFVHVYQCVCMCVHVHTHAIILCPSNAAHTHTAH